MKIYHSTYSPNARKVLVTAFQLGLNPELVNVDIAKGEQRKPEFSALNANSKVPVLVDEDFVLTESQAILAYLADKAGDRSLYPIGLRERADVNRWMFWSANHWGPAISMINWERAVKKVLGLGDPDPTLLARGESLFADFAKVLDAHLAGRSWISGKELTLADISVGCMLMLTEFAQLPVSRYPNIERWFGEVQKLESWKRAREAR